MRNTFLLLLAVVIFSCGACSKDGATGPAGAAGAAGATGPAGPAGTAGVLYSDWIDVAYDPITGDFDDDGKLDTAAFQTTIPVAKLDKEMLTNGEVKVYINLGTADDPSIYPLPYFDIFAGYSINPRFDLNSIYLLATNSFQTYLDSDDNMKHQQYRYVLIPGGTAARSAAGKKIDWNNYSEVKAYMGWKN